MKLSQTWIPHCSTYVSGAHCPCCMWKLSKWYYWSLSVSTHAWHNM